jgi:hypothetical protein
MTLYFNDSQETPDFAWSTLANWWTDAACTVQASALPAATDDVVINSPLGSLGAARTVANATFAPEFDATDYTLTVTGVCTFNNGYWNRGTITGDCVFNGSSYNLGTITGICTFNDSSYNDIGGTVNGDCTFNDNSYNIGTITGDCTFYDNSYNSSTITGTIYLRMRAAEFAATGGAGGWIGAATTTTAASPATARSTPTVTTKAPSPATARSTTAVITNTAAPPATACSTTAVTTAAKSPAPCICVCEPLNSS